MPKTPHVEQWLQRARDDLSDARLLLIEGGHLNNVAFLAQQAVEKYLKGYLAFHRQTVHKIHELEILLESCLPFDPSLAEFMGDAKRLTPFAVTVRYPADMPDISESEAHHAVTVAEAIAERIERRIATEQE